MKNKIVVIGGIAAVAVICAFVFMSGGKTNTLTQAQNVLASGEPEQAIELLTEYTNENPTDAKAWLMLGDAYKSIETYALPVGNKYLAVKSYWEGYKLGDKDCTYRLIWEMSPLVNVYMEGLGDKVGEASAEDYRVVINKLQELRANKQENSEEGKDVQQWLLVLNGTCSADFPYYSNNCYSLTPATDKTDENYLWEGYITRLTSFWGGSGRSANKNNFNPSMLVIYDDDKIQKTLEITETPFAISYKIINITNDFSLNDTNEIRNKKMQDWVSKRINFAEPQLDKIDKAGKLMIADCYLALNDSSKHTQKIIDLLKDSVKGPYAMTTYPAAIFSKVKLTDTEFNSIKKAILPGRYSKDGGKWEDVINKIDNPKWEDVTQVIPWEAIRYDETYFPWIIRAINVTGTYNGQPVSILFPVRYNSLKDCWDLIIGKGVVMGTDYSNNVGVKTYGEAIHLITQDLVADAQKGTIRPDELDSWMIDILKPTPEQAKAFR